MKKTILILLALCVMLSLCSCKKSEAAQAADDLIAKIGTVSLESGEAIEEAEAAVEALKNREKKSLEQYAVLEEARKTYDELVEEDNVEKITAVEKLIDKIGTVSAKSESVIKTAQDAYDKLDDGLKERVSNAAELKQAHTDCENAQIEEIEDAINKIGTVTLESEDAITSARKIYDGYKKNIQEKVSNYETLTNAEQEISRLRVQKMNDLIDAIGTVTLDSAGAIQEAGSYLFTLPPEEYEQIDVDRITKATDELAKLQAARIEELKKGFVVRTDEVQGTTFYLASTWPQYINDRPNVLPYIGEKQGNTWMKLRFNYTGNNWVFFKSAVLSIDGENETVTFNYWDITHDSSGRGVTELIDIDVKDKELEYIRKIANSQKTIIRFQGDHDHYDFTVSDKDKAAMKSILECWDLMNYKISVNLSGLFK